MISLFPTISATLQLPVSLEPIYQFQRDLLYKVTLQMMYTINQKHKNWFDQIQTRFAWLHHI